MSKNLQKYASEVFCMVIVIAFLISRTSPHHHRISACVPPAESENSAQGFAKSRIGKCLAPTGSAAQDKLKASNFPANTLKIGSWEVGLHMKFGESHCYVVFLLFSIQ